MDLDPDDLVTIDRFLFIADAEVALATLEAAGIDAVLQDENIVRIAWSEAGAHGGVRLQVRRSDAEAAMEVLKSEEVREVEDDEPIEVGDDYEPAIPPPTTEICRRCGSEEVYPVEKRVKTWGRAIISIILGTMILNLGMFGIYASGHEPPMKIATVVYIIVIVGPIAEMIFSTFSPMKRCRKCNAEWRGEQRTV